MIRYALIKNARTRSEAEAYMPGNYSVIAELTEADLGRERGTHSPVFVIAGKDERGWTLNDYVIPRCQSGLLWVDEIDLSHPVMKQVAA